MALKVWSGSAWQQASAIKVWNGTAWTSATAGKVWNGSAWVEFFGFTPTTYDTATNIAASGTVTIPSGATTLILEVWSGGGGGGAASSGINGYGGGGGGYSKTTFTVSSAAGKTIQYARGAKGTGGLNPAGLGTNGGSSTSSSGVSNPFSMQNISITGGTGGNWGGTGSPPYYGIGGVVTNNNAGATNTDGNDGFLSSGGFALGGDNSNSAGGGGDGETAPGGVAGSDGQDGRVIFTFT